MQAFLFVEVGGVESRQTKRCEENRSKIDHSWRKKQKRAIKWREVGNHVSRRDPREGVPVLYLILSLPQSQGLLFIQRSNVRHFLPGGNLIHCFSELLCHWLSFNRQQHRPFHGLLSIVTCSWVLISELWSALTVGGEY